MSETMTVGDTLDEIESELTDNDRVELSDEQMHTLGIWSENNRLSSRQPNIHTKRAVDPVKWSLYDVSDIDGRGNLEFLALVIHDKQQGERYTRPYAIGLGEINIEPASNPDESAIRERFNNEIKHYDEKHTPESLNDEQMSSVVEFIERSDEMLADAALANERGIWATAYDGKYLYVESSHGKWEGFESIMQPELTDDQLHMIKEVAIPSHTPRHLETTSHFSFKARITFN